MADIIRIKRRASPGSVGAPPSLANAELAYNENDHVLYIGEGTGGAGGSATVIVPIAGSGMGSNSLPLINGTAAAGTGLAWSRYDHVHPTDTSRAPINSPTFTGVPAAPTVTPSTDNSTKIATTAFVQSAIAAVSSGVTNITAGTGLTGGGTGNVTISVATNGITNTLLAQMPTMTLKGNNTAGTANALDLTVAQVMTMLGAAPLASPTFTGTPLAPTATGGTNTTQIATTAFVQNAIAGLPANVSSITAGAGISVSGATGAVTVSIATNGVTNALAAQMGANTLKGNNTGATANAADLSVSQVMTMLGAAPLNSPTFTGLPLAPTAPNGTNTTQIATTAFVLAQRLDQHAPPQADISLNNFKITGLADPVSAQDAVTKSYADNLSQGLDTKGSVKAASTANLTLSGTQTVDGVALVANDRVLVKDQASPSANGIYVVQAGAWTRSLDMNTWAEVPSAYTFVEQGTVNADSGWNCISDQGGTIDSTPIIWTQFSGAGSITAGAGLTKSGNTIDAVGTAQRIVVLADSIDIDSGYVGQTSITTLGTVTAGTWNASTITVARGGTGATTLTGYVKGNGTGAMTASATIPNADIAGLGTMALQNANAVAITGGTIDGITFDGGTF